MTLALYIMRSLFNGKIITPFDFYEWLFFTPGYRSAWLIFFSFMGGFFLAMTVVTGEYMLLSPAVICLIAILTFGIRGIQPIREIIKKVAIEKIVEKEKRVFVTPGSNCGTIYIMRRGDGVLKFGKARHLGDRLRAHRKDYQADFNIVSSWIVPDMDRFEAMALSLTNRYFYQEDQRRELRLMSDSQLTQFILEFTDKVHKGWTQ